MIKRLFIGDYHKKKCPTRALNLEKIALKKPHLMQNEENKFLH